MFKVLFLLFVILPIIEITILMQVGAMLGVWPTIAIIVITAWLGAKMVRQQGISTMQSLQTKMAQGQLPSEEIVAGMLLLVSGVLLVTPGFVTDFFGLALFLPKVRQQFGRVAAHYMARQPQFSQTTHFHYSHYSANDTMQPDQSKANTKLDGNILDGEFERKD